MAKLRAAAYCRVSSNKSIQLRSLKAQKKYYEEYFRDNPLYEYVGIYADIASGIKSTARKEFDRMIKDCKKGRIDIIFTKSISRFSRDTYDFLVTIRKLKEIGVDVYFQNEMISLNEQEGEFMMTVFEAAAQQVKYNAASVAEITAKLKHAKARSFGVAQDRLNTPLNVSHVPSNRRRLTSTQGQYCK